MKLLLLPLLLGFSVPAIAHNEANGGCGVHCEEKRDEKRSENDANDDNPVPDIWRYGSVVLVACVGGGRCEIDG